MMFVSTLIRVITMLAYAVPGFLFIKSKWVKPDAIPAFATLLLYVCSPALVFYTFSRSTYTPELNRMILITFGVALVLVTGTLLLLWLILRRRYSDVRWRVFTIASALGNVGFFGIPLLEHFLSATPNAFLFSEVMSISMNMVAWTLGMFLLSGDKKFMRPLKIVTVPSFLAMLVAYPMFLFDLHFPAPVTEMLTLLGKMSTPVCMLILGMRLATVSVKELVTDWRSLLVSLFKLTVFPLIMFGMMMLLPIAPYARAAMFLLACCPCASVVLSLCELNGRGQKSAANAVLISTILCVITIPVMSQLILPLIIDL